MKNTNSPFLSILNGMMILFMWSSLNACTFTAEEPMTKSTPLEKEAKTTTTMELATIDKEAILGIMKRQEACWNTADVDCFMNGYWESDSLRFMGKNGITYGYNATLERYKKTYPTAEDMGKLTFGLKSIEALSENTVLLVGTYHLKRTGKDIEDLSGYYSLIWKRIDGEWVIVLDHSS